MRILIVDSDRNAVEELSSDLQRHAHDVRVAADGAQALDGFGWAHVVVTELDLADLDGVNVCREIRSSSEIALIVLSGRTAEIDRVLALRAGADDFVPKPYGLPELLARIEAVMRRSRRPEGDRRSVIAHSELRIDPAAYEVRVADRPVEVTRKEFDLLKLLASEPQEVVTRQRIMAEVWQDNWTPSNSRTIDTHVNTLRRKLGAREWIHTVRGVGFRIGAAADRSLQPA